MVDGESCPFRVIHVPEESCGLAVYSPKMEWWRTATLELLKADSFDEVVISVWRQIFVQNAKIVELEGKRYFVKRTSRHHFRQVDFTFNGQGLRGIEQNPETGSRWAKLAGEGKKVMQFLRNRRYVAVVVDGQVFTYDSKGRAGEPA
jgi:hypothetical protein